MLFSPEQYDAALTLGIAFKKATHIALLPHYSPDPDALGAVTALALMAKQFGISTEIIYPGGIVTPLPYKHPLFQNNIHTEKPDLIICCDTAHQTRLYYPEEFTTIPTAVIDHHMTGSLAARYDLRVPSASSTCEMIVELARLWDIPLTKEIADILLCGLLADTQTLRTTNTTARTLSYAQELVKAGSNIAEISASLIPHTQPEVITLWGSLLAQARFSPSRQATWTIATPELLAETNTNREALIGFVNHYSSITTLDVCILFSTEEDGRSKASIRSKKLDVNALAGQFGGGGHRNAAGITSTLPLAELVSALTKLLP